MLIPALLIFLFGLGHLWRTRQGIRLRRELESELVEIRKKRDDRSVYREIDTLQRLDKLPADCLRSYAFGILCMGGGVFLVLWMVLLDHYGERFFR
jgi:hypothetical protein